MRRILLPMLLILPLILDSCAGSGRKSRLEIIPEDKMAELLIDTHLADAILFTDISLTDVKRERALYYYPSVLDKYGITKAQMDSSVAWYVRNPEAYARIYDKVVKDLEERQAALKKTEITE
jgi:predicted small lipoprotein YifL